MDLVAMLRLARNVIGDDQFMPEQAERCEGLLDVIDSALTRRSGPGDWEKVAQS